MAARATVDAANRYPGTLSRTAGRAVMPATDSSAANANQMPPKIDTEMPWNVPNRLA